MKIYVQSRGQAQDRDYCWIRITDKGQQQELPSIPEDVIDLIESDDFSVALARSSGQLLLLVTGLESSRRDFQRRIIRNSIAWVGQNSDEPVLRELAARALRGLLRQEIDQVVKGGDGKEGFKVSLQEIQQLTAKGKAGDSQTNTTRLIGPNSEPLKHDLADQLEQHQLPQKDGTLVIVTEITAQKTLEDSGVWRSLSSSVKTESWKEIPDKKASSSPQNNHWTWGGFCFSKIPLPVFISVVGLGAVSGVLVILLNIPPGLIPRPPIAAKPPQIVVTPERPIAGETTVIKVEYDSPTSEITLFSQDLKKDAKSFELVTVKRNQENKGWGLTESKEKLPKPEKRTWNLTGSSNQEKGTLEFTGNFTTSAKKRITVQKKDTGSNVIECTFVDITVEPPPQKDNTSKTR
jgi:hypothetical protein